ncbi:hypothetical protein GCM10010329_18280 [Streptomyces spiroverticillatus]|uniref:DUF4267 domain-containing protein n=1 Tax=Streptomyces finlayi TaxID=67296 RepID=A0A918WTX7_9ACTN|nr:DUF4267 domain-containing protein [Streptomyces finlayi]GGZ97332.1 hypothetical protein GCM10010329_18280 [Streptomyces spiroverticillatus]GHC82488.1 hypothetical protein GCM10010334_10760 [Streptomyces finlayi]
MLRKINTVLATAFVLFILWFGSEFILTPAATAPTFGLPTWPSGDGGGFLVVKGVRDVVMGLTLGALLVTGNRRALGWALLVGALAAFGDMGNVLAHHGDTVVAFSVHGLTAVLMVVTGLMFLRETRSSAADARVGVRATA